MAISTNNGPRPNKGEIKQILNFIKDLLPNKYVRALDVLLHPCCNISGVATATCIDAVTFNVSIVLDSPLNTVLDTVSIVIPGAAVGTSTYDPATKTISTEAVFTGTGPINTTGDIFGVAVAQLSGNLGVFAQFAIPSVIFDSTLC